MLLLIVELPAVYFSEFLQASSKKDKLIKSYLIAVFTVLNALFAYGIYALYRMLRASTNENRALQESIVETSGMFQHIKV